MGYKAKRISGKHLVDRSTARYERRGECARCGKCCEVEDPSCPHLFYAGNIAVCAVFGKPERYRRCALYPEAPPLNFKTCGYYFIDTWQDNEIVRDDL